MTGLNRVVGVLLDVVPGRGQDLVEHGGIDRRGVSDHLARDYLQRPQRPGEEPAGGRGEGSTSMT
jgi:hypothetical protein